MKQLQVSVCMITYNHEKFIEQAVRGILNQRATFSYEIIIADDNSTDNTKEILRSLKEENPDEIKLFLRSYNVGMMENFRATLEECTGKYIAICEGDDYWIDENKLQKQVDFLEANSKYAICFHRVYEMQNGEIESSLLNESESEETYSIEDLAKDNFIHTPSVVFRNGLIREFPVWFSNSPVGDYVLHMLNARYGLIKYLPQPMAVYRVHAGGTWGKYGIDHRYPKWAKVLDLLMQEDFSDNVRNRLLAQKVRLLNVHIYSLFHNDYPYDSVREILLQYYCSNTTTNEAIIIDALINEVKRIKDRTLALQNTGSYKLAKKVSKIKNKFFKK